MKYGYFDDEKQEYVITDPKTPYPWINYLGTERFFSLISNGSGGYSFYRDALLRRITRYRYNNVPLDSGGKYFYIKDGDNIWNPGWRPSMGDLDTYQCRHGMGYTEITGEKDGIRASTLFFVPPGFDGEVQRLSIKNTGSTHKSITAFAYLEWCLWHAYHDMTNFQRNFSTGQVEIESRVIYHKTEYRERRNHFAFYSCSEKPTGFDSDRESFVGTYNGYDKPKAVVDGACKNSVADGWAPVGAYQFNIDLPPGTEKEIVFALGYVENPPESKWVGKQVIDKSKAEEMIDRYGTSDGVKAGLRELSDSWSNILSTFSATTPDEHVNRMVNIWNPYQCMVTYNMGRSASYFESGIGRGLGFRDTNQDLLGCIHQIPARARERILDVAATQFEDGSAYHQYQPLTKQGNFEVGRNFNDDPLWLILSTTAYIRETDDWSILDEHVPYDNNESSAEPLFKHIEQSFRHVINNLGPHGLPLIGRADWNDCLNLNCFSEDPDDSFQTVTNKDGKVAESVMIAGLFVYAGRELAELCDRTGRAQLAVEVRQRVDEMAETVCAHGWDGSWFLRAYDDFGNKLGSDELDEGKIFIESQGWCAMAGIGSEKDYPARSLDSVKTHLDSDFGIVMQQPAFSEYYLHLGEISSYPEGYKENAGIFCHNNPWIIIAEAMANRTDDAFEHYSKICPSYLEDVSDVHRTEPYVYAQMIAGKDAPRHGEAKNSWLTGTAAWNYVAITQWILGIRPSLDGLIVDPKIPGSWGGFSITRRFRDNVYTIIVTDPQHIGYGVESMTLDGTPVAGNIIPIATDTGSHVVSVVLGGN